MSDGPGYRVKRTPKGTQLDIISIGGGRPGQTQSTPIAPQLYRIKQTFSDVYRCRTWDRTLEGSTHVYVAKNAKLRNSIASEVIDSINHSYAYDASYVL